MGHRILPKVLTNRTFSTNDAYALGLSKHYLKKLLDCGEISKITRGYYKHETEEIFHEESRFESASVRVGKPACICLVSALIHYELTDLIGKKVWIMVPHSLRRHYSDLRIVRVRSPQWDIGISKNPKYWITDLDRTLVEGLIYKRLIGINTGIEALRRAITAKKTSLGKVYEMSKKLKVDHRILPYIEAHS